MWSNYKLTIYSATNNFFVIHAVYRNDFSNRIKGCYEKNIIICLLNIHENNLLFSSAAVSYTVAEQFNQSIEMEAITRSSKIGRSEGECFFMKLKT